MRVLANRFPLPLPVPHKPPRPKGSFQSHSHKPPSAKRTARTRAGRLLLRALRARSTPRVRSAPKATLSTDEPSRRRGSPRHAITQ